MCYSVCYLGSVSISESMLYSIYCVVDSVSGENCGSIFGVMKMMFYSVLVVML